MKRSITKLLLVFFSLFAGLSMFAEGLKADFDGDGFEDMVLGMPREYISGGAYFAGAVKVVYGRVDGTFGSQSQTA